MSAELTAEEVEAIQARSEAALGGYGGDHMGALSASLRDAPALCASHEGLRQENARLSDLVTTLEADRDAVILERDRLKTALEPYADESNWLGGGWVGDHEPDLRYRYQGHERGTEAWDVAREALASVAGEEES